MVVGDAPLRPLSVRRFIAAVRLVRKSATPNRGKALPISLTATTSAQSEDHAHIRQDEGRQGRFQVDGPDKVLRMVLILYEVKPIRCTDFGLQALWDLNCN
jgi:hypothetical protein